MREGLLREAVKEFQDAAAAAGGLPLRMSEGNTKSKGGIAGVSDAFASALFATDFAFELAAAGAGRALCSWSVCFCARCSACITRRRAANGPAGKDESRGCAPPR
jgi:hypothetical protein